MKVNRQQPDRVAAIYSRELNRTREVTREKQVKTAKSGAAHAAPAADQIVISEEAREVRVYREKLAELPDERPEKVEELRREVTGGTYRPDARKVAEALAESGKVDRLV